MKKFIIPIYRQLVYIENNLDDDDYEAKVEFNPLTLRYDKKHWCFRVMAHECVHLTSQIFKRCGLDILDWNEDEHFAYLYSFIFENVYKLTKEELNG